MTKDEIAIRLSLTYAERLIEDYYFNKSTIEDRIITCKINHKFSTFIGEVEYYLFISFDEKECCYILNHSDSMQFISKNKQICITKIPFKFNKNSYISDFLDFLEGNDYYSNIFTQSEIRQFLKEKKAYYQAEDKKLRLELKLSEKDDKTTIKRSKI